MIVGVAHMIIRMGERDKCDSNKGYTILRVVA